MINTVYNNTFNLVYKNKKERIKIKKSAKYIYTP